MRQQEQRHGQAVAHQQRRIAETSYQPCAGQAHASSQQEECAQQQRSNVGSDLQPLLAMMPHRAGALQRHYRQQDGAHESVSHAQAAELAPHLLAHMGGHLVATVAIVERDKATY